MLLFPLAEVTICHPDDYYHYQNILFRGFEYLSSTQYY